MNNSRFHLSLRHVVALAIAGLGIAAFAGCAVDQTDESNPASETLEQAPQSLPYNCCNEGSFKCASNGYTVDWSSCEGGTATGAANACRTHCGGVACTNLGTHLVCLP